MSNIINGYIGTYTDIKSKGIYKFEFNEDSGSILNIELAGEIENPTYLCINKNKDRLYSVSKNTGENNEILGGVASFDINDDYSLSMKSINTVVGKPPCHVNLNSEENFLLACNYHDKHCTSYSLDNNLHINKIASKAIHTGVAHMHFATPTHDNKYICILDLGRAEICLYSLINGILKLKENLTIRTRQGSGPRHMVFSPCGNFAYVLCELSSEVITLKYLGESGFELVSYTSTLPATYNDHNATAAIRITSNGKYLYCSNRGHNSIAAYKVNPTGLLELIGLYPTYGIEPRDFNLSPNEKHLIIGNHKSDSITVYKLNNDGTLELVSKDTYAPSPVCITFA